MTDDTNIDKPVSLPVYELFAALLEAQKQLASVGKDATNHFDNFKYASSDGMIAACRVALHKCGLVLRRSSWRLDPGVGEYGMVVSTMVLSHPKSNSSLVDEVPWFVVPMKGKPIDKALAGALTTALSYYLRDLLQVPREDSEEEHQNSRDDRGYEPRHGDWKKDQEQRSPQAPPQNQPYKPPLKGVDSLRARVAADAALQLTAPDPKTTHGIGGPLPVGAAAKPLPTEGGFAEDWRPIKFHYVDQKTSASGKVYVAAKTIDGTRYVCFEDRLLDVLLAHGTQGVEIVSSPGEGNNPARILAVREVVQTQTQTYDDGGIPF